MISTYFILSAVLFSVGLAIVITRKNAIFVLMGIELMLNAANINLVAMTSHSSEGHFFALFVIVVAAAEAAIALAIVLRVYQYFKSINLDRINELKN